MFRLGRRGSFRGRGKCRGLGCRRRGGGGRRGCRDKLLRLGMCSRIWGSGRSLEGTGRTVGEEECQCISLTRVGVNPPEAGLRGVRFVLCKLYGRLRQGSRL